MPFQRVAINKITKEFGLIPNQCGKVFTVLWQDGSTSESNVEECQKAVFNSPTFFKHVSPERNAKLLESAPNQLFLEVLWERKCNHPENASMDAKKFKQEMLLIDLGESQWDKLWSDFKDSLSETQDLVSSHGLKYFLISDEFNPADPVVIDWESLRASHSKGVPEKYDVSDEPEHKPEVTSPDSLRANKPETDVSVSNSLATKEFSLPKTPLEIFEQSATGKSIRSAIASAETDFLKFYTVLATNFVQLPKTQRAQLLTRAFGSKDAVTLLIAHMLDSKPILESANLHSNAVKLGQTWFMKAANDSDSLTTDEKLAASKLLEVLPGSATLNKPQLSEVIVATSFVFSMSSPKLKILKEELADQLCLTAKKTDVNLLTSNVELKLTQILMSLSWRSPQRAALNDVLIKARSPIVLTSEFWHGFSATDFLGICASPFWNSHLMSTSLRPVVEKAVAKLLQSLSAHEAMSLLPISNQIESLVGAAAVKSIILLGMTSQSSTKTALAAISNIEEIELLRSQVESQTKKLNISAAEAEKNKFIASNLELKIELLEAKIAQAGEASEALREGVKQQFELDAARKVVRILAFIDETFGPQYEGKQRVLALANSLGISSFANAGDTAAFDFTHFDDHEGSSAEGDSVKVLAPGYSWGVGEDSIVLLKAIVIK